MYVLIWFAIVSVGTVYHPGLFADALDAYGKLAAFLFGYASILDALTLYFKGKK